MKKGPNAMEHQQKVNTNGFFLKKKKCSRANLYY